MKFVSMIVALASIVIGRNVRLPGLMKIKELAQDIMDNGLQTPPVVYEASPGSYEVIQGHRRISAIKLLQSENPELYAKWFPEGIPVTIVTGISYEDAQLMKIDHGNEVSLTDPMEIQLCANMLFAQGKSEKDVVTRLALLMDRMKPMKSDKRKIYDGMLADADLLEAKGNKEAAITKRGDAAVYLFNYRRGMVQNLHNAYRCPQIVMAALYFKATGEVSTSPDMAVEENTVLPKGLTYLHVTQLWKAFEKDLEIKEGGIPKFNKRLPGPGFQTKWEEICKELSDAADAKSSGDTRPKAMSVNELQTEVNEGKFLSAGFKLLTLYHARAKDVDVAKLANLDKIAYFAEMVHDRSPDEWTALVKLAEGLEKEQNAATKETAPPPAPEKDKKASKGRK